MSYREKTAWLSLIAMVATFGPYFTIVATRSLPDTISPTLYQLGEYAATVIAQLIILGCGHLYLRLSSPQEARTPPDERDRAIMGRAMTSAYSVMLAGMIYVGCIMPFTSRKWSIVHSAFFMIVTAELVRYGVVVVSYRRQS